MFIAKERKKNSMYPYHSFEDSKQEMKKNKFFKEKMFLQKRDILL